MKEITHVFFDLDHTLWDFETNSREVLDDMFEQFELNELGVRSALDFIHVYEKINDKMWAAYREGSLSKQKLRTQRFPETLLRFSIHNEALAVDLNNYYLEHSPRKTNLFDHAHTTLEYLANKYQLYIITNGFEEVQGVKMNQSNLNKYFEQVITSEQVGVRKPDPKIFEYALLQAQVTSQQAIMIGDDLNADVLGAINVGMHGLYFNPKEVQVPSTIQQINCLSELRELL